MALKIRLEKAISRPEGSGFAHDWKFRGSFLDLLLRIHLFSRISLQIGAVFQRDSLTEPEPRAYSVISKRDGAPPHEHGKPLTDHPLKTERPRPLDWAAAGAALERLLAARNLSSQILADKAGVDRKTVDRLRRGEPVRLRTLAWIETALGASLRMEAAPRDDEHPDAAPARLGAYARPHYRAYEGWWWGFRRSFDYRDRVICHSLRIHWDEEQNHLAFEERQSNRDGARRRDYEFRGVVSIPAGLGVLYFMIVGEGAVRVSATTLLRENAGESYMKGVMLALGEMAEVGFYPVVTPLYLVKAEKDPTAAELEARLGSFEAGRLWRGDVIEALADVEARFCRFSAPPPGFGG